MPDEAQQIADLERNVSELQDYIRNHGDEHAGTGSDPTAAAAAAATTDTVSYFSLGEFPDGKILSSP